MLTYEFISSVECAKFSNTAISMKAGILIVRDYPRLKRREEKEVICLKNELVADFQEN